MYGGGGLREWLSWEKWRKRVEFSAMFFVLGSHQTCQKCGGGGGDREVCWLCLLAGLEKLGKSLGVCWQCAFRHL